MDSELKEVSPVIVVSEPSIPSGKDGSRSKRSRGASASLKKEEFPAEVPVGVAPTPERLPVDWDEVLKSSIVSDEVIEKSKRRTGSFYKLQNEKISRLTAASTLHRQESEGAHSDEDGLLVSKNGSHIGLYDIFCTNKAVTISFCTNICLLALKIYLAVITSSLVVLASTLDSFLDVLSSTIFAFTVIPRPRSFDYPVGQSRLQPLGIVIFSSVMGMTSIQIAQESITSLATGSYGLHFSILELAVFVTIIGTKLILYIICRYQNSIEPNEEAEALSQDHFNDVISNSFSLAIFGIASKWPYLGFLDPLGALLIFSFILYVWILKGREQIQNLVGKTAPPEFISQIIYLAMKHDHRIRFVDSVVAYYCGVKLIVEVHIVLDPEMPLHEAHDIGDSLQYIIERMEEVERAFVHLDVSAWHKMEH